MSLLGATMVSVKSKSGRRWYVHRFNATLDRYVLHPLGDDVRSAQVGGQFQGGVRNLLVPYDRLNDPTYWRPV